MSTDYQKYKVTTPLIDDSCKDGSCNHKHIHEVSNAPEVPKVELIPQNTPHLATVEQSQDHSHEIKTNHTELAELMPKGVNFAKCADGSCGNSVIQNSKITRKFKECENCGANTVPNNSDICPTCGIKEPQDEEDKENFWNESQIDSEKIGDDE